MDLDAVSLRSPLCPGLRRRLLWAALCVGALVAPISPTAADERDSPSRHEVQAAFLYKFTDFVEWPAGAINGTRPFVICVDDQDFADVVERTVERKKVRGLRLEVTRLTAPELTFVCDILFLGSDSEPTFDLLRSLPRTAGTLTVSDGRNFTRRGGMIGFFLRGGKVRFEINLVAAEWSGFKISSRLLKVARVVR